MRTDLEEPRQAPDRPVRVMAAVALAVTAVGLLVLLRTALVGGVEHGTVRVDNQASLPLEVDLVDAGGTVLDLGVAQQRATTGFPEVPVPGAGDRLTVVASYGGREVFRQATTGAELAGAGWTARIPAAAATALERAGFR
jgi:hypothetical protein